MASGRRRAELTPRTARLASTKRCYHAHVWPDRPAARRERRAAEGATTSYPRADSPDRLLDDDDDADCLGAFWSADAAVFDPLDPDLDLDFEAIAAWEQDPGGPWDADQHEQTAAPEPAAPEPRASAREHPRCRLCRKVRHRYAQTSDGLLRVCLGCAQGLPLARLTASEAAAELIALRRPAQHREFIDRLRSRFPELPWDTGIIRVARRRRHARQHA